MEPLIIRSGRNGFILPEAIVSISETALVISSEIRKGEDQVHTGIELLAQTGALHVRHIRGFDTHAFLLKIDRFTQYSDELTPGPVRVSADLRSQSSLSFAYDLTLEQKGLSLCRGHFLFALREYDGEFRQDLLQTHYQRLFACLTNDSSSA